MTDQPIKPPPVPPRGTINENVAIKTEELKKTFNGKDYVLQGVTLEIPRGKITVIIGFSGTGKSRIHAVRTCNTGRLPRIKLLHG